MRSQTWDILFNLILFLFWFRVWPREERSLHFNPYLAPLARLAEAVIDFLRPVFFGAPPAAVAAVSWLGLLALRGLAAPPGVRWPVAFGFESRYADPHSVVSGLLFSALSFGIFLFQLWGLSLLYARVRREAAAEHTTRALCEAATPFTRLRPELRPFALLGFGLLLGAVLAWPADGRFGTALFDGGSGLRVFVRLGLSACAAFVSLFALLQSLVVLLILGSWVAAFTAGHGIAYFCRDWLDFLMGPMRRLPVRIGMLDLTPLVFLFALLFLDAVLSRLLWAAYARL